MDDVVTRPAASEQPLTAGFWPRLAALMIDWVACLFVVRPFLDRDVAFGSQDYSRAVMIAFFLEIVLLTWLTGASAGQRLLRMHVVRVDGGRPGIGRVVVRTALLCLAIPPLLADRDGRGLHDRAAGTVVTRTA